jgi:hypothetical protein
LRVLRTASSLFLLILTALQLCQSIMQSPTAGQQLWRIPHVHRAILDLLPHHTQVATLRIDKASFVQGIGIIWERVGEAALESASGSVSC